MSELQSSAQKDSPESKKLPGEQKNLLLELWLGAYAPSSTPKTITTNPIEKALQVADILGAATLVGVPIKLSKGALEKAFSKVLHDPKGTWELLHTTSSAILMRIDEIIASRFFQLGGSVDELRSARSMVIDFQSNPQLLFSHHTSQVANRVGADMKDFIRRWSQLDIDPYPLNSKIVVESIGRTETNANVRKLLNARSAASQEREFKRLEELFASLVQGVGFPRMSYSRLKEVSSLAINGKIVEGGSGHGLLAAMLQSEGIQVVAIENNLQRYVNFGRTYHKTLEGGIDAIQHATKAGYETILLSYPTPGGTLPADCLKLLASGSAKRLIMIPGEFFVDHPLYAFNGKAGRAVTNIFNFWDELFNLGRNASVRFLKPEPSHFFDANYPIFVITKK